MRRSSSVFATLLLAILSIPEHAFAPIIILLFVLARFIDVRLTQQESGFTRKLLHIAIAITTSWVFWILYISVSTMDKMLLVLARVLTFDLELRVGITRGFIYSDLGLLRRWGEIALIALYFIDLGTLFYHRKVNWRNFVSAFGGWTTFFALLCMPIAAGLALLYEKFIFERIGFFLYLVFVVFITSVATAEGSSIARLRQILALSLLFYLTLTYTLRAFPQEAYLSRPDSDWDGISFLASQGDFRGGILSTWRPEGFSPWILSVRLVSLFEAPTADIKVFYSSAYYEISMIYDLSFENNTYLRLREESLKHDNLVYMNPSFQIFEVVDR
jgi:hypothetical protein